MRILILGHQRFSWLSPAWARCLSELDVEVVVWDWSYLWPGDVLGRIQERFIIGPNVTKINNALLDEVDRCRPDVILLHGSTPIMPFTIKKLAKKIWLTSYHPDDPFGKFGNKAYFRRENDL